MVAHLVVAPATAIAAAQGARQALKVAEAATKIIEAHKQHLEVTSRELSLRFPEDTGELSIALAVKAGFFHQKLHFPISNVFRLTAHSLPWFKTVDQAVSKAGDEFILDGGKIPSDVQGVRLLFEYRLQDPRFLDGLVQRNQQLDPKSLSNSNTDSYWLTAQLRNLESLKSFFQKLELIGLDCKVDVGVHQDVKAMVPHKFNTAIERSARFIGTRDREELRRLA